MRIALSTTHFGLPHFVHAMEFFYMAAEYAVLNPDEEVEVVIQPHVHYRSRYVAEFIESICRSCTNFRVVLSDVNTDDHPPKKLWTIIPYSIKGDTAHARCYQWFTTGYRGANKIRDTIIPDSPQSSIPRVGLVNRKNTRILLNADAIQQAIEEELGLSVDTTYFEDKSLLEQARFFKEHRIIISPHGAQLCSIPFAPDGACIIECCHDEWHPMFYFPGLSSSSGKVHVMLCDDISIQDGQLVTPYSTELRNKGIRQKKLNIYMNTQRVVQVIRGYLNDEYSASEIHCM